MTHTTQIVSLNELTTLRLVCLTPNCGTVIELPFSKLTQGVSKGKCPGCGKLFGAGDYPEEDALHRLASAVKNLAFVQTNFSVEFPVNDKCEGK